MKRLKKSRIGIAAALLYCLGVVNVQAASVDQYLQGAKQYQQKGDYRAAIVQLKNALQQDPNQAQARLLLAQSYLKIGDGASAEKELKRAKDLGVKPEQILPLLGQAYLQQRKYKDVLDELKPDKVAAPKIQAALLAIQGDAYQGLGKNAEAQKKYTAALKLDADSDGPDSGRAGPLSLPGFMAS